MSYAIRILFACTLLFARSDAQQDEALLAAARKGDLPEVKRLIAAGASPNVQDASKVTPLMLAAKGGHIDIVRELLAARADPNAKDAKGLPAIYYCGGVAQPSIIADMIAAGARPDERDPEGDTLLLKAAAAGDATRVDALVSHGANPNVRDKAGNTPLIRCAWWTQYDLVLIGKEEAHAAVVDALIAHGADPNLRGQDGMTALMRAAAWSHSPTLKALLAGGADPNIRDNKGRTSLSWAARNTYDRKEFIQPLIDKGAKLGLTDALLMGDLKKARELIDAGADLSGRGGYDDTPLMIAAEWGDLPLVNALLRRKVDVNARDSNGYTALMIAAAGRPGLGQVWRYWTDHGVKKGRGAIVRALAHAGADLEAKATDWSKDTALILAIEAKNLESAEALIAAGANPNKPVEIYESLVELAAAKEEDSVVLALLRAGADVTSPLPRHCVVGTVANSCKPETLRAVIRAGAPVNSADLTGTTPLMSAAWKGKLENARILLKAGAQVNRRNKDGNSTLDIALDEAPKSGVPPLLLKRGAKVGLIEALLMGDRARALAMIRSGANVNIASHRGYSPLIIACEWADLEMVRALLNRRAENKPVGRMAWSPLIFAACGRDEIVDLKGPGYRYRTDWTDHGKRGRARIPIIQELLARGAKVQQADGFGQTALERASTKGDLEVMTYLMDHGADPNYVAPKKDSFDVNSSPLQSAAGEGQLAAVELLLARGAKVNGEGGDLRPTPLFAAASKGHVAIVRLLLSKGADPAIRNWDGYTVLQIAEEHKDKALIDLLSAGK